jgi:hypothetical protein
MQRDMVEVNVTYDDFITSYDMLLVQVVRNIGVGRPKTPFLGQILCPIFGPSLIAQ